MIDRDEQYGRRDRASLQTNVQLRGVHDDVPHRARLDYLDDNVVVKLLDWIHSILRPGGRVILGNFHPRNPTRAMMDHVLEWRLIHRDEADMHRLARASALGTQCTRVLYEPQRIDLFAEIVK